jgi:dolichol-phosphate mannosyltransferase
MTKKVVILLPTYNEKENLGKFINEVFAEEKNNPGWKYEILVVDSGSPDGTLELAKELAKKNPRIHTLLVGRGLGVAFIEGHKYSIEHFNPDALAQLDADGQVKADVLPRMLKVLDEGYNLALGSRFVVGGKNLLSPSRKLFTWGSSVVSRLLIGPWNIKEWSNSARAFTPELFKKIDFNLVPWQEKTFIIQPAFLHAAVEAGAKYKEVPLIFKNRAEGYSKMKVFNYTYDVISYELEARLHKWGIKIPLFRWSRRGKTLIKFSLVGLTGTLVDFLFYKFFINQFGIPPATSKGFSAEVAILNNFTWNNFWTFRYRKTKTNLWQKLGIFNVVSLGGLAIGVLVVKFLHSVYGDGMIWIGNIHIAYNNFYFFATIPPVMAWNFTVNHFITWRQHKD